MLLNDIGKSPDTTFRKINQHLETNYGFKIAEDVSDRDLVAIMEQIEEEITELKIKGDDAKASPEISKRLLVLEGIKTLREFAILQFQSPDLDRVVGDMVDFVVKDFRLSGQHHGDFEQSIKDAMKQYRSSKYRFPDDAIEQRVRQGAMSQIQSISQTGDDGSAQGVMDECSIFEEDDGEVADEDAAMKGIEEEKWIETDPKKAGMFKGKTKAEIDSEKAALKKKHANQEGPISAAEKTKMHELQFASRAKSKAGLEEDDPWGSVGKRASAIGGHAAHAPDTPQARHAMKALDNPSLSLAPTGDEQVSMVRDKHGRMVPDPFKAQKAARYQGIVHKEGTEMKEHANLVKNLRRLLETEVSQAEVMMAAKGFAQELQEMIEKIGRLQNEDLPPVTDQMRETYGTDSSSAFQTQIYGALQGVMDSLYTAKGQVDDAVGNMASTGQVGAETDMDVPIDGMGGDMGGDMGVEPEADLDNITGDEEMGDEFGAEDEEEPLGRAMKEAKLQRKVLEMKKLVEKAKKLKEAKRSA